MTLTLQPTRVATGGDEEGMLVFADGRLVAVLVHLSDENEIAPGDWHWDWIVKRLGTALTLP